MLTLANLKASRIKRGLHPADMTRLTGISAKRYRQLELHTRDMAEPWFDEAAKLARVLNTDGIRPLMAVGALPPLSVFNLGTAMTTDRDLWRSGLQLDLATACRIAVLFGLDDPIHLVEPPRALITQIWTTLETGERGAAPGACPWCLADLVGSAGHLPTCLPHNLWGERSRKASPNVSFSPAPKQAGRVFGASGLGHGLRRLRDAQGITQAEMGALFGIQPDHYAKMERCVVNIPVARAECLANKLGIDVNAVFHL